MRTTQRLPLAVLLGISLTALLASCGGDEGSTADGGAGELDAQPPDDVCRLDSECDDGLYCNGAERCAPDDPSAGADGCVAGDAPCADGCDEDDDACGCDVPDADGDGEAAFECGGHDCDDEDPRRYPGADEICDPDDVDEDCDPTTFGFRDNDSDGAADALCCNVDSDGARQCGTDCDDTNAGTHPSVPEACDAVDNDCDGVVDERVVSTLYRDGDGDGFGTTAESRPGCMATDGWATTSTDCDDTDPTVSPGQLERCNGADDDCDGMTDEGVLLTFYLDSDGDTYGVSAGPTMMGCVPPAGYAAMAGDCDDIRSAVHPGATELCDGFDTDCVGGLDFPGEDDDGDGFGDRLQCAGAPGATDCDDSNPAVRPGAPELCDRIDNDCSSGGGVLASEDQDGDGHAAPGAACSGGPLPKDDCDDARSVVVPGFVECGSVNALRTCGPAGAWQSSSCPAAMPLCDARTDACVAAGAACGDHVVHAGEECDDGNATSLDGCDAQCRTEPGVTRPIAPYSGSAEASRRPTFRVSAASGAASYEIAVSASRTFTSATTFSLSSTSGTPSSDLPIGPRYWRVRAVSASGAVGPWSAIWSVRIGRMYGDFTGDGRADWVASAPNHFVPGFAGGRVYLRAGGSTTQHTLQTSGSSVTSFGNNLSSGDFTCDGHEDLVVTASDGTYVFAGGAGGTTFDTGYDLRVTRFTGRIVGDLDGDGCADLAARTTGGSWEVYRGAAMPDATSDRTIGSGPVLRAGDVNGDGFADVAVVVAGGLEIHTNVLTDTTAELTIPDPSGWTSPAVDAADLDRDGYSDLIVVRTSSAGTSMRIDVYRGGSTLDATSDWNVTPSLTAFSGLDAGQDTDGDGFLDFVLCGQNGTSPRLFVYRGATGLTIPAPSSITTVWSSCGLTGDANADGRADIVGGDSAYSDNAGRAALFSGATRAQLDQTATGYMSSRLGSRVAPY